MRKQLFGTEGRRSLRWWLNLALGFFFLVVVVVVVVVVVSLWFFWCRAAVALCETPFWHRIPIYPLESKKKNKARKKKQKKNGRAAEPIEVA